MNETRTYRCNKSTVIVREGNILDSNCDVIVSTDNVGLQMSTGVSRTIHEAAGVAVDIDLDKVKDVELGDVVVTSAGALSQRYLFHCIADKRRSSRKSDIIPIIINRSVLRCLQLLPLLNVYSISFPIIGTGAVGLSVADVANTMLDVISEYLMNTNKNLRIEIYAWGVEKFNEMIETINKKPDFELYLDNVERGVEKDVNDSCDVFISYSWKDQEVALALDEWLTSMGVGHFLDRNNIKGGQDHKSVIIQNLKKVKVVLFLSSKDSNISPAVKGEISNAIYLGIPIIPLRLDMTPYRDEIMYDLVNNLWVDVTQGLEPKLDDLMRHIESYGVKTRCR